MTWTQILTKMTNGYNSVKQELSNDSGARLMKSESREPYQKRNENDL